MSRNAFQLLIVAILSLMGDRVLAQKLPADVDPAPRLALQFDKFNRFGLTVIKTQDGLVSNKLLTFAADGKTNDCLVRVDNQDFEIGSELGKWILKNTEYPGGYRLTWAVRGVYISQIVEIVPSRQPVEVTPKVFKRLLDTCLVRYEFENKDTKSHIVGARVMVDTLIGGNDGVPFAVPTVRGMVNTLKDFRLAKDVPDFVQALEVPDLKKPGTIGHMTLKVGGGIEAPNRVSLTHWLPPDNLNWEIPVANMGIDSCVVMYWDGARTLLPKQKRTFGYAYGLGKLSAGEGTGRLATTVNGTFKAGTDVTVTAYLQKPGKLEQLVLEVPKGVQRVRGNASEIVPPPVAFGKDKGKETSTVTWTIRVDEPGTYEIRVRSTTGVFQTQRVTIRKD